MLYARVALFFRAGPPDNRPGCGQQSAGSTIDPMNDAQTTVQQLRTAMAGFVADRGWQHHHRPKHLAMSIAIEAAELMEHFQWTDAEGGLRDARFSAADREAAADELADVLAYVLSMANALEIDLAATFSDKMKKNAVKYPKPSGSD